MAFVDLSHAIEDGMITYPGLPAPRISTYLSFEASRTSYGPRTEFQIGRIDLVANTGTYVDAPAHRFASRPVHEGGASSPITGLSPMPSLRFS
jgi:kynurenine formamidase